ADCAFLCGETETLQHLFFQCPFSSMVWREVLLMCNIARPLLSWAEEVLWMSTHARGSAFHHTVRRLAFAATVYHLWIERNRRCFKNAFLPCQEIIRLVKQDVCGKL
ncbi:hypothetical protein CFOL_v3_19267, partial [Cephalotus follicularis]